MEERARQMKLKMNKYKPGAGSDSRLEQDHHKVTPCSSLVVCASPPTAAATYTVLFAWMLCAIWWISQDVTHEHMHISRTRCAHKLIMLMKTYQSRKTLDTPAPKTCLTRICEVSL